MFNFFKKEKKEILSIKEKLKVLIDNIPENYFSYQQYKNCVAFYNTEKYELALQSIIELCEETKHFFSNEFWNKTKEISLNLNLKTVTKYCEKEIKRNAKEIKYKLPFGFTTNKINENNYQTFISKKITEEWNEKRRKEDEVEKMLNSNGVHYKPKGRNGYFYFVEDKKIAEIEYEIDLYGLLLFFRNTKSWVYPKIIEFEINEKNKIKREIEKWSENTKNKLIFD